MYLMPKTYAEHKAQVAAKMALKAALAAAKPAPSAK